MNDIIKFMRVLVRTSRGVRGGMAANVMCGCATVLLSLSVVWATRGIVSAACDGDRESLTMVAVMFCIFLAGRLLSAKCGQRLEAWCVTRLSNNLRSRLFVRVMEGCFNPKAELHSADVVSRLSADVGNISVAVCSTVPAIMVAVVSFAGAFLYLAMLAPLVAVAVALLMPLAILVGKLPAGRTYRLTHEIREEETEINSILQDDVSHRILISTIGYSGRAAGEFNRHQSRFFKLTMRRNDLGLFAGGAVSLGFMAGYAVMFLYCAYGIIDGTVSFATMTAMIQLTAMVQQPVVDLSHKLSPLVRATVSADRIAELETHYQAPCNNHNEDSRAEIDSTGSLSGDGCDIIFKNVWFRYNPGSPYILKDFNETIPVGKVTAIYGETGLGKTTLLRLLLGLCQPERGTLLSPFTVAPGFRDVVYVPQGNTLISGTVRSNLLMGNPLATDREIDIALHTACAEFAKELPEGLDTRCGENGYGFSEGQAQRIAIARAILRVLALMPHPAQHNIPTHNCPAAHDNFPTDNWSGANPKKLLILLDEPTAALDTTTESRLMERLTKAFQGHTLVIVTHKTSLRRYANKILSLQPR